VATYTIGAAGPPTYDYFDQLTGGMPDLRGGMV
jgi:hypothetical protein